MNIYSNNESPELDSCFGRVSPLMSQNPMKNNIRNDRKEFKSSPDITRRHRSQARSSSPGFKSPETSSPGLSPDYLTVNNISPRSNASSDASIFSFNLSEHSSCSTPNSLSPFSKPLKSYRQHRPLSPLVTNIFKAPEDDKDKADTRSNEVTSLKRISSFKRSANGKHFESFSCFLKFVIFQREWERLIPNFIDPSVLILTTSPLYQMTTWEKYTFRFQMSNICQDLSTILYNDDEIS